MGMKLTMIDFYPPRTNQSLEVILTNQYLNMDELLLHLGLQINARLQADRRQQADMAGVDIKTLLTSNLLLVK